MLLILSFVMVFATLLYFFAVFRLWRGWEKTTDFEIKGLATHTLITVIIPIRNEERNITYLLDDLLGQKLPYDQFEIIIIDDYSEDNSFEIVTNFKHAYPHLNLSIFRAVAPAHLSNKKRSLTQALRLAKGELIVCTDGDSRVQKEWLIAFAEFYEHTKCCFISAPVAFSNPKSFFEKMQIVEFSSLIVSGASSIYYGYPIMSNGANIAYTKEVFEEVGGFDGNIDIRTGDDTFLMQKIFAKHPTGIRFLKNKKAIVRTPPLASLYDFYNQRIRWASKWKQQNSHQVSWVALCVFAYHLLNLFTFIVILCLFAFTNPYQIIILGHFLLKFCIEFVLLTSILDFAGDKKYCFYILPLQLIYSFYIVVIGILSNFASYHWKGRTVNKS